MRPLARLTLFIIAAVWLWLADSLLLTLASSTPFTLALFSGVPTWRLLVRLFIILALLLAAFMSYIGNAVRHREVVRMNKADKGDLFGDADSSERSRRLLYHSMRLATVLKMTKREQDGLRVLCYCYDLGMIGVPKEILAKEGELDHAEQRQLDGHTQLGAEIAAAIPQLRRAAPLIACHEERYNGGGPRAMYGRSIPLACRIFCTVMLYDYLTQPHAGGRVMDDAEALDELRLHAGAMLDPDVVTAFCELMTDDRLRRRVLEHVYAP